MCICRNNSGGYRLCMLYTVTTDNNYWLRARKLAPKTKELRETEKKTNNKTYAHTLERERERESGTSYDIENENIKKRNSDNKSERERQSENENKPII